MASEVATQEVPSRSSSKKDERKSGKSIDRDADSTPSRKSDDVKMNGTINTSSMAAELENPQMRLGFDLPTLALIPVQVTLFTILHTLGFPYLFTFTLLILVSLCVAYRDDITPQLLVRLLSRMVCCSLSILLSYSYRCQRDVTLHQAGFILDIILIIASFSPSFTFTFFFYRLYTSFLVN